MPRAAPEFPVSQRLQPLQTLTLSKRIAAAFLRAGFLTVEDILRWRKSNARAVAGVEFADIGEIDRALSGIGLFRAEPIPDRDWRIYLDRRKGVTFARLASQYDLAPEGARAAYLRVRATLAGELEIQRSSDTAHLEVRHLPLPTRAKLGLQRARIFTLKDLLYATGQDLGRIRGLGAASIQAIQDVQAYFLGERGRRLEEGAPGFVGRQSRAAS